MSSDLRTVGLWWDGQKGRAKHDGVEVYLRRAPVIGRIRADRVEFDPALGIFDIADSPAQPRRDMLPDEIDEANLFLLRMSSRVREFTG